MILSDKKIMYILLKHFLKQIRTKMHLRHKENFCTDHNNFVSKQYLQTGYFESACFLKGMRNKQTHHFPLCTEQNKQAIYRVTRTHLN